MPLCQWSYDPAALPAEHQTLNMRIRAAGGRMVMMMVTMVMMTMALR
jgi:hypothetical protein